MLSSLVFYLSLVTEVLSWKFLLLKIPQLSASRYCTFVFSKNKNQSLVFPQRTPLQWKGHESLASYKIKNKQAAELTQTPDSSRLVREYSHKNPVFVFVCALASHENRFCEQKKTLKPKHQETSSAQEGLRARPTGFSTVGWMSPREPQVLPSPAMFWDWRLPL